MQTVRFFIPGDPPTATAQQKGVAIVRGRPRFYTKKSVAAARLYFAAHLRQHRPKPPFQGPVSLRVQFALPHPKAAARRSAVPPDAPHVERPDADNLAKLLVDAMTDAGFWLDDSQVFDLSVTKFRSSRTGVAVDVLAFDDADECRRSFFPEHPGEAGAGRGKDAEP